MQRCPYIHEMKERLLGQPGELMTMDPLDSNRARDHHNSQDSHVGTIVKLNSDGYGSHTSPAHVAVSGTVCTPLMGRGDDGGGGIGPGGDSCGISCDLDDPLSSHRCLVDAGYSSSSRSYRTPKNAKTSLFIIMSFIYAKLLVVICIAYVISDVITHNLPLYYYEGFFTYLYGMSILFLLYVFCFLLQESSCCHGSPPKAKPPPKEKKQKQKKEKKEKEKKNKEKEKETKKEGKKKGEKDKEGDKDKDKDTGKEKHGKESKKTSQFQQDIVEVESAVTPRMCRKRKTTQNDHSHGSFFLRIGAIAFGLGTMIYNGLEFGTFFEVPFESPCYQILRGLNPVLQMVFTFMQMYFIFMNSRLNIHRFKVVARFGLMHVVATNLCVWIRTLVIESLKEITAYHLARKDQPEDSLILESIRQHTLKNAGTVLGQELGGSKVGPAISPTSYVLPTTVKSFAVKTFNVFKTTAAIPTTTPSTTTTHFQSYLFDKSPQSGLVKRIKNILPSTRDPWFNAQPDPVDPWANDDPWTTVRNIQPVVTSPSPLNTITTSLSTTFNAGYQWFLTTVAPILTTSTTKLATQPRDNAWNYPINNNLYEIDNAPPRSFAATSNENGTTDIFEALEPLLPAALVSNNTLPGAAYNCGRVNIMGTIVQDSAPYLYPFIIEYSLIGAAVIYVMWKHIGRHPRLVGEAELERRLEAVVARRAAALAQARRGARVDCAGASKGLFCGLLLLVAALICLILFFVLVRHPRLGLLAIYLADVSHCALMTLSIFAIIIGFIRVQGLKFRSEEQSDLNDILLRVSAFGLFVYAVFSVIAGSLGAFTHEPNLLVMITGALSVVQVVLQLLFIADVSRRRVHLPEQERSKPARQVVTFLLICNVTMWLIYTFEAQKVVANPVQLDFYGFLAWSIVQRVTLPLCIFHRFHSAVTLAEIWKTSYKARLE